MRGAFVVQLGPETRPTEGQFEGWVEEDDSGTELRFLPLRELLLSQGTCSVRLKLLQIAKLSRARVDYHREKKEAV